MRRWAEVPTLSGRSVTLRPLTRGDRGALLEALAPLKGLSVTEVPEAATIDAWFGRLEREAKAGRVAAFAVLDEEGRVAGTTRFLRMAPGHRRVEIGGTLYAPRVQRTALNTEAKRLLLAHAFDGLGCQCVQLRTNVLNRRSRAAIERLGARLDGVLRGHLLTADGEVRDSAVYSIQAHEWPQVRRHLDHLLEASA